MRAGAGPYQFPRADRDISSQVDLWEHHTGSLKSATQKSANAADPGSPTLESQLLSVHEHTNVPNRNDKQRSSDFLRVTQLSGLEEK